MFVVSQFSCLYFSSVFMFHSCLLQSCSFHVSLTAKSICFLPPLFDTCIYAYAQNSLINGHFLNIFQKMGFSNGFCHFIRIVASIPHFYKLHSFLCSNFILYNCFFFIIKTRWHDLSNTMNLVADMKFWAGEEKHSIMWKATGFF